MRSILKDPLLPIKDPLLPKTANRWFSYIQGLLALALLILTLG